MSILTTSEAKNKIAEQVAHAKENLQIISAFCKIPAVEFFGKKHQMSTEIKKDFG